MGGSDVLENDDLAKAAARDFPDCHIIIDQNIQTPSLHNPAGRLKLVGICSNQAQTIGIALYDQRTRKKLDFSSCTFSNEAEEVDEIRLMCAALDGDKFLVGTNVDSCVQPVSVEGEKLIIESDLRHDVAGEDDVSSIVCIKEIKLVQNSAEGSLVEIVAQNETELIEEVFEIKENSLGALKDRKVNPILERRSVSPETDSDGADHYEESDQDIDSQGLEDEEEEDEEAEEDECTSHSPSASPTSSSEEEEVFEKPKGSAFIKKYMDHPSQTAQGIAPWMIPGSAPNVAPVVERAKPERVDAPARSSRPTPPLTARAIPTSISTSVPAPIPYTAQMTRIKHSAAPLAPASIPPTCMDLIRAMDNRIEYMKSRLSRLSCADIGERLQESCGEWSAIDRHISESKRMCETDSHLLKIENIENQLTDERRNLRNDLQILDVLLNAQACSDISSTQTLVAHVIRNLSRASQQPPQLSTWISAQKMLYAIHDVQDAALRSKFSS